MFGAAPQSNLPAGLAAKVQYSGTLQMAATIRDYKRLVRHRVFELNPGTVLRVATKRNWFSARNPIQKVSRPKLNKL